MESPQQNICKSMESLKACKAIGRPQKPQNTIKPRQNHKNRLRRNATRPHGLDRTLIIIIRPTIIIDKWLPLPSFTSVFWGQSASVSHRANQFSKLCCIHTHCTKGWLQCTGTAFCLYFDGAVFWTSFHFRQSLSSNKLIFFLNRGLRPKQQNARNNHVHATCTKLEVDGKPCRIKVGAIDAAALGSWNAPTATDEKKSLLYFGCYFSGW